MENFARAPVRERSVLDPRTKAALAIAFSVVLMMSANPYALAIAFVAAGLAAIALGLTRAWLSLLRVLVPMAAFFVVVMIFSFDVATVIAGVFRLAAMATAFFIFFQTTSPEELANALVASGVPYAFAFILTTSMQYIPVLTRKMQDIMDAQRARGIRLERDLASLPNFSALFAPLLIQSFTLGDQLAEAMEARGFGAPNRTFADTISFGIADYFGFALSAVFILIAWVMR